MIFAIQSTNIVIIAVKTGILIVASELLKKHLEALLLIEMNGYYYLKNALI